VRISVVVGNPRASSRTLDVATRLGRLLVRDNGELEAVIDLAEHAERVFDPANPIVVGLLERVAHSDIAVIASPTYKAAYTGLLKAFLDLYPDNGLRDVVAVPVMTAGSPLHGLAVETQLRPVLVELGAIVPTRGLCAVMSRYDEIDTVLAEWVDDQGGRLPKGRAS
jgi:FMN reductase